VYTTLCKQNLLVAFLSGTDVCTQATPLIAFLIGQKLGPHATNREHALQEYSWHHAKTPGNISETTHHSFFFSN